MIVWGIVIGFVLLTVVVVGSLKNPNGQSLWNLDLDGRKPVLVKSEEMLHTPEGRCLLCSQPLHKLSKTTDEIVSELERRIETDTDAIVRSLVRPAPEAMTRIYHS
jgi:hypothetical protein